jgi:hypothetical protein
VYDFSKGNDGECVGPLYDVIYEALMRVVEVLSGFRPYLDSSPVIITLIFCLELL